MDRPLDPQDELYVPLCRDKRLSPADPVELLSRTIQWTPGESIQLFSGFRGTGKSTELRRLRKTLQDQGYLVVLSDIGEYLNLTVPVDVSDFLMAVAGAFSEGLVDAGLLTYDPVQEGYWSRLWDFLGRTKVELSEFSAGIGTGPVQAGLKANLKSDPTFKARLQQRMAGHIGALVADVRLFFEECFKRVREQHGQDRELVFLVDSVEHIRGTSVNAVEVQSSVETVFAGHPDKLRLPYVHVVYTVPPYLKVRYANLGSLYEPGGLQVLSAIRVRDPRTGRAFRAGLSAFEKVARARGDWQRLLGERAVLDSITLSSGGHLRDFLRILAEILRRAESLPVPETTVAEATSQIRSEFLPIADSDARWLARIAETHRAELPDLGRLPDLARFLDTHLVLCYRIDSEWYDVHPLIAEHVAAQARQAEPAAPEAPSGNPAG